MTAAAVRAGTRRIELDGLRGVAALAVVAAHVGWLGGGGLGVDVFFVLSGYLITRVLLGEWSETGGVDLVRFWRRRFARLAPALLATVAACVVFARWLPATTSDGVGPALLYVTNWQRAAGGDPGALAHTWSLGIEEQFYVLWPVVLLVLLRWGSRRAFCVCLAVIAFVTAVRLGADLNPDRIENGLDLRADGLLAGCAVALAGHLGWQLRRGGTVGAVLLVVLVGVGWFGPVAMSLVVVGSVLVISAPGPRLAVALSHPALRWVGTRSYGLYLWHYPISLAVDSPIIVVVSSLAVADLSWRLLEQPARRVLQGDDRDLPVEVRPGSGVDPVLRGEGVGTRRQSRDDEMAAELCVTTGHRTATEADRFGVGSGHG